VTGTAKATQEADNVIILQKIGPSRYLDVRKNRFDGELGKVNFKYMRDSGRIFEERYREDDDGGRDEGAELSAAAYDGQTAGEPVLRTPSPHYGRQSS
jgi:hypothetical protein